MPPIGWYLAQGLIPLGYDSSDDDEGPAELPDGRLVCGPHGFVTCGKCCVDFSFMDDVLGADEDDEEDDDVVNNDIPKLNFNLQPMSRDLTRGTGRVFPTEFTAPSPLVKPLELFSGRRNHINVTRFTLPSNPSKGLILTDGACLENGRIAPKAGWAFWHGLGPSGNNLIASSRLEAQGPFGSPSEQTSNRAELRAVIAALRFRHWPGEGFRTLVFATDSEYVVLGSTKWARNWVENGWVTRKGVAVKNKDLWEALLGEIEKFKDVGMTVEFWRIPREWNVVADAAAKEAAAEEEAPDQWMEMIGMAV
ncbi:ribonuclease H-like domain-containing protein [Cercophora newfieldiana]|uniref:ribonuclease H n=1 Tax=Cercophora newfieldiana TaxID=92897 RepID=A0AA40D2L0_9PEZI|nr:ribonuclease H-like domain-containing protein [Cercophora newfieldiana]